MLAEAGKQKSYFLYHLYNSQANRCYIVYHLAGIVGRGSDFAYVHLGCHLANMHLNVSKGYNIL